VVVAAGHTCWQDDDLGDALSSLTALRAWTGD
jgi:hypothetical protein